jgi:hypothetical protein
MIKGNRRSTVTNAPEIEQDRHPEIPPGPHDPTDDVVGKAVIGDALRSNDVATWDRLYAEPYGDQTYRVLTSMLHQVNRELHRRKTLMRAHEDELSAGPTLAGHRREYAEWRSKTSYFASLVTARLHDMTQRRERAYRAQRDDRAEIRNLLAKLARAVWQHRQHTAHVPTQPDHVLWLNLLTLEIGHAGDYISLGQWVQDSIEREKARS